MAFLTTHNHMNSKFTLNDSICITVRHQKCECDIYMIELSLLGRDPITSHWSLDFVFVSTSWTEQDRNPTSMSFMPFCGMSAFLWLIRYGNTLSFWVCNFCGFQDQTPSIAVLFPRLTMSPSSFTKPRTRCRTQCERLTKICLRGLVSCRILVWSCSNNLKAFKKDAAAFSWGDLK